jgi:hypothetical protein
MSLWDDDRIQFARLISEIAAVQDNLDWEGLCDSMDLTAAELDDLFERAHVVWERAKESI